MPAWCRTTNSAAGSGQPHGECAFRQHISKVDVMLDLSGGWNGDMYAYLLHDGVTSVLLNRVGTPGNGGLWLRR